MALSLPADAGAYSLTGVDAAVEHGWRIAAGSGGYNLTGSSAGLLRGAVIAAGIGAYALAGGDATFQIIALTGRRRREVRIRRYRGLTSPAGREE